MKCTMFALSLVMLLAVGCGGAAIPRQEYSLLQTPQETYEFAKRAVSQDDPEAFYHCLADNTRNQFSLSELKVGWALAGGFFYLFLDAKLKDIEVPAPEPMFRKNPDTAKLTMESHNVQASFLLHREDGQWRLIFPAPYPLPDISKIKMKTRPQWRTEIYAHYRFYGNQVAPHKSPHLPQARRLSWRTEEHYPGQAIRAVYTEEARREQMTQPSADRLPAWRNQ